MRVPGRPPVMLDIVEEHFDELDWLWEHREANVFTPDWTLDDLAWCEERAEAHLDGLRLAELHGVDLALSRLDSGEASAALAATLVLGADPTGAHLEPVQRTLRAGDPPLVDGVRRALRHDLPAALRPVLEDAVQHGDPLRAAAAADVLAFRREVLALPAALFADPSPLVVRLALGAAARLGRVPDAALRAALEHADPLVRRAALHAAAHTGWPELLPTCRKNVQRTTDPDPEALAALGAFGEAADEALLRAVLARPELAAGAVHALGALGRVTAVPLLLDLLRDRKLAVPAAKAYRRLTGSAAAFGAMPFPRPPVAEGEDESEELPPAPDAARADWQRRASQLPVDACWQFGRRVPPNGLPDDLDLLPLDCRRDLWLRQRARRQPVPDLELEALALRQRR